MFISNETKNLSEANAISGVCGNIRSVISSPKPEDSTLEGTKTPYQSFSLQCRQIHTIGHLNHFVSEFSTYLLKDLLYQKPFLSSKLAS